MSCRICRRHCGTVCGNCCGDAPGFPSQFGVASVVGKVFYSELEASMALPERPIKTETTMNPNDGWVDPEFKDQYPSIFAFMFDPTYANGKVRRTGSLSIFTKMGTLTCAVNDNDRNAVAYVNAGTWEELLYLVEEGILNDSLGWRGKKPFSVGQTPPF